MYLVLARPWRGWAVGIPWPSLGCGATQYHVELLATQSELTRLDLNLVLSLDSNADLRLVTQI